MRLGCGLGIDVPAVGLLGQMTQAERLGVRCPHLPW